MKKNIMMRVAGGLLVATLLSTSIISGTFAKYVTRGEVADQARVAKFGVVVTGSGDLFSTTYKKVSNGNGPSAYDADEKPFTSLTVESSDGAKLVAPGTKNANGLNLAITGAPEVDVKITLSIDSFTDIFLKADATYPDMTTSSNTTDTFSFYSEDENTDYHPVLFTLKTGDGEVVPGCDGVTLADMQAALEDYSVYVDANTDLSDAKYSYTLSWEWAFEGPYSYNYVEKDSGILMNKKKVDQADTLLGDIIAAKMGVFAGDNTGAGYDPATGNVGFAPSSIISGDNYSTDISVSLSLTVTQVD